MDGRGDDGIHVDYIIAKQHLEERQKRTQSNVHDSDIITQEREAYKKFILTKKDYVKLQNQRAILPWLKEVQKDIVDRGLTVQEKHIDLLRCSLSREEVKRAIFSILDTKAQCLDGYNSKFLRHLRTSLGRMKNGGLSVRNILCKDLSGNLQKVTWNKVVWNRYTILKHNFTKWIVMWHRLPTKEIQAWYGVSTKRGHELCDNGEQNIRHLFRRIVYSTVITICSSKPCMEHAIAQIKYTVKHRIVQIMSCKVRRDDRVWFEELAKLHWLNEGDANSRVFYNNIKKRRIQNFINTNHKEDGIWVQDPQTVVDTFVQFYKNLLVTHLTSRSKVTK
ncbi:hypothetical protein RDABS01_002796, partial [Bienertia sinuspersici]